MQQLGKSLPESIVDYVIDCGGLTTKLERLRTDYVAKEEFQMMLD